jgi:hypothetical protein
MGRKYEFHGNFTGNCSTTLVRKHVFQVGLQRWLKSDSIVPNLLHI